MTSADYKATPEQWLLMERSRGVGLLAAEYTCLLELRARVEALEAAENYRQQDQDAERAAEPAPADSLVERVATFITPTSQPLNREWARDGICQVAGWLRERGHASAASALEQEAGQ
jgi:hypothetical protein